MDNLETHGKVPPQQTREQDYWAYRAVGALQKLQSIGAGALAVSLLGGSGLIFERLSEMAASGVSPSMAAAGAISAVGVLGFAGAAVAFGASAERAMAASDTREAREMAIDPFVEPQKLEAARSEVTGLGFAGRLLSLRSLIRAEEEAQPTAAPVAAGPR